MIGVLIIAHGPLGEALTHSVAHVLGSVPENFAVLGIGPADDPLDMLPKAREIVAGLQKGRGVLIFTDIFGATPSNLCAKLIVPGQVEVIAGVNLPMLVRAFTYRNQDLQTMIKKAISGGCEGVIHVELDPVYATTKH